MQFLLTDGSIHQFSSVVSADVEDGLLVGRNRSGELVVAFARVEVLACGEDLALVQESEREHRRNRSEPHQW
jgi:hypothetical protein